MLYKIDSELKDHLEDIKAKVRPYNPEEFESQLNKVNNKKVDESQNQDTRQNELQAKRTESVNITKQNKAKLVTSCIIPAEKVYEPKYKIPLNGDEYERKVETEKELVKKKNYKASKSCYDLEKNLNSFDLKFEPNYYTNNNFVQANQNFNNSNFDQEYYTNLQNNYNNNYYAYPEINSTYYRSDNSAEFGNSRQDFGNSRQDLASEKSYQNYNLNYDEKPFIKNDERTVTTAASNYQRQQHDGMQNGGYQDYSENDCYKKYDSKLADSRDHTTNFQNYSYQPYNPNYSQGYDYQPYEKIQGTYSQLEHYCSINDLNDTYNADSNKNFTEYYNSDGTYNNDYYSGYLGSETNSFCNVVNQPYKFYDENNCNSIEKSQSQDFNNNSMSYAEYDQVQKQGIIHKEQPNSENKNTAGCEARPFVKQEGL